MFCRKCGQSIAEDSDFCSKCGVAVLKQVPFEEPQQLPAQSALIDKDLIQCWRCASQNQVSGQVCTVCGVTAPEHRAASLPSAPVSDDAAGLAREKSVQSIKNRKAREDSTLQRKIEDENRANLSTANGLLIFAYLLISLAVANFIQAQSLLTQNTLNIFGTIKGSSWFNILTGGFWGGSPQPTFELVLAIQEAYGGLQLTNLMTRSDFSSLTTIILCSLILVALLLIKHARKSLASRQSGSFFFFFWS
jgi:hypothetical protein